MKIYKIRRKICVESYRPARRCSRAGEPTTLKDTPEVSYLPKKAPSRLSTFLEAHRWGEEPSRKGTKKKSNLLPGRTPRRWARTPSKWSAFSEEPRPGLRTAAVPKCLLCKNFKRELNCIALRDMSLSKTNPLWRHETPAKVVDKAIVDCIDIMRESREDSPHGSDIKEAHRGPEDICE